MYLEFTYSVPIPKQACTGQSLSALEAPMWVRHGCPQPLGYPPPQISYNPHSAVLERPHFPSRVPCSAVVPPTPSREAQFSCTSGCPASALRMPLVSLSLHGCPGKCSSPLYEVHRAQFCFSDPHLHAWEKGSSSGQRKTGPGMGRPEKFSGENSQELEK